MPALRFALFALAVSVVCAETVDLTKRKPILPVVGNVLSSATGTLISISCDAVRFVTDIAQIAVFVLNAVANTALMLAKGMAYTVKNLLDTGASVIFGVLECYGGIIDLITTCLPIQDLLGEMIEMICCVFKLSGGFLAGVGQ